MDQSKNNFVVHISEIPLGVKEADIKNYFKDKIGADVRIGTMRQVKNRDIPLQWARVDFRTPEHYEKAIEEQRFPVFQPGHSSRLLPNDRDIISKDIAEKNVFVKGLDKMKYDNEELYDMFKQFGSIDASKISKTVKNDNGNIVSQSNGYGFVKFADAEKAKEILQKAKFEDPSIVVEPYLKDRKRPDSNNLYVKNFSEDVDEDKLREAFAKYGEITSVKVMQDENSGKKFGYVCFKEEDAAKSALEMHGAPCPPISDDLYVQKHVKKSVRRDLLQKAYKKQNLFVRNFGEEVTEKDLHDCFSTFGTIMNTKILTKKTTINGEEREISQCKGFVCFESPEEAKRAVDEAKERGIWFDSKRLNVSLFEPRSERASQNAANKGMPGMNPEISEFIMNFFQNMQGSMGGMNPMGGMPPGPGPMPAAAARAGYTNKLPPQARPPRNDMYNAPPRPNMGGGYPPNNPGFNPGMMGAPPNMGMGGQPGFDPMKMGPPGGMGMMPPPQRAPMPPMNQVSEDAIYSNQYNELVNSAEYQNSDEDDKRNKFGDLIFPYVEKISNQESAPKITGMIIDLELPDLEQATNSLASLKEKINEGLELLEEEGE